MLKIVNVVLGERLLDAASAAVDIGDVVSGFLVEDMPLDRACELSRAGSLGLLGFVWKRGLQDAKGREWTVAKLVHCEPHYRRWEFGRVLLAAVSAGDLVKLQWVLDHFPRCPVPNYVVTTAAGEGHLWVLQLLENCKTHGGIEWSAVPIDSPSGFYREDGLEDGGGVEGENGGEILQDDDQNMEEEDAGSDNDEEWEDPTLNAAAQGGHWELAFHLNSFDAVKWLTAIHFEVGELDWHEFENGIPRPECRGEGWPTRKKIIRYLLEGGHGNREVVAESCLEQAKEFGDLKFALWISSNFLPGWDHGNLAWSVFVEAMKASDDPGRYFSPVEWLDAHENDLNTATEPSKAMFAAAGRGRLDVVQWLHEHYGRHPKFELYRDPGWNLFGRKLVAATIMDAAAESGNLELLQFLHRLERSFRTKRKKCEERSNAENETLLKCTATAMDVAAQAGHLHVVKWLHENRPEGCTTSAMDSAGRHGHLAVVEWLHTNRSEGCTTWAIDDLVFGPMHIGSGRHTASGVCCEYKRSASAARRFEVLKFLHANRSEGCTHRAMNTAARQGKMEMLQWLHTNTTASCTKDAMDDAARMGRLDMVTWLHENRKEGCSASAASGAAANGNLEMVKWLFANRSECSPEKALDRAAASGRLVVVKWLLANYTEVSIAAAMAQAGLKCCCFFKRSAQQTRSRKSSTK